MCTQALRQGNMDVPEQYWMSSMDHAALCDLMTFCISESRFDDVCRALSGAGVPTPPSDAQNDVHILGRWVQGCTANVASKAIKALVPLQREISDSQPPDVDDCGYLGKDFM